VKADGIIFKDEDMVCFAPLSEHFICLGDIVELTDTGRYVDIELNDVVLVRQHNAEEGKIKITDVTKLRLSRDKVKLPIHLMIRSARSLDVLQELIKRAMYSTQ
jgi:hypothetical protein